MCGRQWVGFQCLLHSVASRETSSSLQRLSSGVGYYLLPERFQLLSSLGLQGVCFSQQRPRPRSLPSAIFLCSISIFLVPSLFKLFYFFSVSPAWSFFAQLQILSHVLLMKGTEHVCAGTAYRLLPWSTALLHCWVCTTSQPSSVTDADSPHSGMCRQVLFPEPYTLHKFAVAQVCVALLCWTCYVLPPRCSSAERCLHFCHFLNHSSTHTHDLGIFWL